MIYDVEKVMDYTGDEPEWKYRITLSAGELAELEKVASDALLTKSAKAGKAEASRLVQLVEAFGALKRQLARGRDLDSIENFKLNRPLPVPAMGNHALDCE